MFSENRQAGSAIGIIGILMLLGGGYLFFNDLLVVTSRYLNLSMTGFAMFVLIVGISMAVASPRRVLAWILIVGSILIIMYEVLSNLVVVFRPASFLETIAILALMGIGIALTVRDSRKA